MKLRGSRLSGLLAATLATLLLIGCAARVADLESPQSVYIPEDVDRQELREVIKDAMLARGWSVHDERDHVITGDLRLRSHFARVDIDYGGRDVQVEYVESRNLKYSREDGHESIHKNFNSWVQNLLNDIEVGMSHLD